jgi:hypothetical protein
MHLLQVLPRMAVELLNLHLLVAFLPYLHLRQVILLVLVVRVDLSNLVP